MALATTDDVRRWLKRTDVEDDDLDEYLAAATEWVERVYGRDWDASGAQTETFYNVPQGAIVHLKDESPSNIVVTGYAAPSSSAQTLVLNTGYAVLDRGRIQLALVREVHTAAIRPEELEQVPPFTWARIQVAYTASSAVPTPVREAVALIAAAWYEQSTMEVGGLQSERMGDYNYTRAGSGGDMRTAIPTRARSLLAPYSARRRARSV